MFTHHDDAEEVEKLRDYANPNDVIVLWYSLWGSFPIAVACSLNSLGSTCRCTLSTSALSGRGPPRTFCVMRTHARRSDTPSLRTSARPRTG